VRAERGPVSLGPPQQRELLALIVVILISLLPDLSYRLLPWVDTSPPFPTS
jgi:hypothetical protein